MTEAIDTVESQPGSPARGATGPGESLPRRRAGRMTRGAAATQRKAMDFDPEKRVGSGVSALWIGYLVFLPFCLYSSGLPQPGDILLGLAVLLNLAKGQLKFNRVQTSVLMMLALFVTYVFIVNTVWAIHLGNFGVSTKASPVFTSAFYIFNAMVFLTAMVIADRAREEFLALTFKGIVVSVLSQVLLLPISLGLSSRQALFFNNPNQLGYYALVGAVLIFVISQIIRTNALMRLAGLVACLILAALSLSKAAMMGIAILMFFGVMQRPMVMLPPAILLGLLVYITPFGQERLDLLEARLETVGESSDDSLDERGYDRIINQPEYWPLGAGEGAYFRFDSVLSTGEIHSTWASTFFSYGFVGTSLFLAFLYMVFRGKPRFILLSFVPIVFYGITHNGSRESLLWIYFAIIASLPTAQTRTRQGALQQGRAIGRRDAGGSGAVG